MSTTTKNKSKTVLNSLREKALSYIILDTDADKALAEFTWADSSYEDHLYDALPAPHPVDLLYSCVNNGQDNYYMYCSKCGNLTGPFTTWKFYSCLCSHCGNNSDLHSPNVNFDGTEVRWSTYVSHFAAVLETTEDYVLIAVVKCKSKFVPPKLDRVPTLADFTSVQDNYFYTYSYPALYIFHKEFGLKRVTEKSTSCSILYTNDAKFVKDDRFEEFKKFLTANKIVPGDLDDASDVLHTLGSYETAHTKINEKNQKARKEKIEQEDSLYCSIERADAIDLIKKSRRGFEQAIIYNQQGSIRTYAGICPTCGHKFFSDATTSCNDENSIECPHCGEKIQSTNAYLRDICDTSAFVDWTVCEEDGSLVANMYLMISSFSVPECEFKQDVKLWAKAVYTKRKVITYASIRRPSSLSRTTKEAFKKVVTQWRYNAPPVINIRNNSDIKDVISKSVFANSGFIEALGLNDSSDLAPAADTNIINRYLLSYYKMPIVELAAKCGMKALAGDLIDENYNEKSFNFHASTIQECFGLTKATFKMARENDLNLDQIKALKLHYSLDPTMTFELFDWSITTYGCYGDTPNVIVNIMSKTGLTIRRIKEYITTCYYNQCISYQESAALWLDYITMMERLEFSDKQKKKEFFPSSLKKEHDVLNFACVNITADENKEKFKETIEAAKKLRYTFGDYMLTTPEAADDIIREGIDLNHSVAQHIELVVDKKEYICFIRRKDAPQDSLYTVEVIGSNIVQVRGNSNCPVKEEEVRFFIKKWAKFKKLTILSL